MFFCDDCGANFDIQKDLEVHTKINHDDRKRNCKICKKELVGHKTYLNHMRTHKEAHCKWCWKTLSKSSLIKHQNSCEANTEKVMLNCTECIFETATKF